MTDRTRTLRCQQCGATYTVHHNRRSVFCSPLCGFRYREATRGPRPGRPPRQASRQCEWCGITFTTNQAKACSAECRSALRSRIRSCPVPWRQCPTCEDWRVELGRSTYCSEFCLRVSLGHRLRATPIEYGDCQRCGAVFIRREGKAGAYCSDRCAKATRKRNRVHIIRSRSRQGECITLHGLGTRDGWRCHICGKTVTQTPGNGPDSPSIDHLVPLSRGGEHIWTNVSLAHRLCNSLRGADGTTQLRLIA